MISCHLLRARRSYRQLCNKTIKKSEKPLYNGKYSFSAPACMYTAHRNLCRIAFNRALLRQEETGWERAGGSKPFF